MASSSPFGRSLWVALRSRSREILRLGVPTDPGDFSSVDKLYFLPFAKAARAVMQKFATRISSMPSVPANEFFRRARTRIRQEGRRSSFGIASRENANLDVLRASDLAVLLPLELPWSRQVATVRGADGHCTVVAFHALESPLISVGQRLARRVTITSSRQHYGSDKSSGAHRLETSQVSPDTTFVALARLPGRLCRNSVGLSITQL